MVKRLGELDAGATLKMEPLVLRASPLAHDETMNIDRLCRPQTWCSRTTPTTWAVNLLDTQRLCRNKWKHGYEGRTQARPNDSKTGKQRRIQRQGVFSQTIREKIQRKRPKNNGMHRRLTRPKPTRPPNPTKKPWRTLTNSSHSTNEPNPALNSRFI